MTRINARLDTNAARKLRTLRERTGATTTEVVKASIDSYYERVTRQGEAASLLEDLIGCADGPASLSENYKQALVGSLRRKNR